MQADAYKLIVAFTTSNIDNLDRLLKSFKQENVTNLSMIEKLSFIIYINDYETKRYQSLDIIKSFDCRFITNLKANHKANDFQKLSITHTRTILHQNLYHFAQKNSNTICWVLDDDMMIDNRIASYLAYLEEYIENDVDMVISPCEGEPANCFYSGIRVQLFDILKNYEWLESLDDERLLPDKSGENKKFRAKFPEYYYDLTDLHSEHLVSPYWIEPNCSSETVIAAKKKLLHDTNKLLEGRTAFRKIVLDNTKRAFKYSKPSTNRGGNAFILNLKILLTPNMAPKIGDKHIRRSDMISALISSTLYNCNIRLAHFPVIHLGSEEGQIDPLKMIEEMMGASCIYALRKIVEPSHSWQFSQSEILQCEKFYLEKLEERTHKLQNNFRDIKTILNHMKNIPNLSQFATKFHKKFDLLFDQILTMLGQQIEQVSLKEFINEINTNIRIQYYGIK